MMNTNQESPQKNQPMLAPGGFNTIPFDLRPNSALIRQKELLPVISVSPSTLWRLVKVGSFPKPIKLSERVTAWKVSEVRAWLEAPGGAS